MSTGRRHPSKLPLRIASYRPSTPRSSDVPLPDRAGIIAQLNRVRTKPAQALPKAEPTVTTDHFHITLPIPPSVNHQYATVNGRRLLSSSGRAYKTQVGRQVWAALAQSPTRHTLLSRLQSAPLALSIRFFFTSSLRRDVDGGLKIAQDALCEGLGLNDNRIVETHLYKRVDKANPRIEVLLSATPIP